MHWCHWSLYFLSANALHSSSLHRRIDCLRLVRSCCQLSGDVPPPPLILCQTICNLLVYSFVLMQLMCYSFLTTIWGTFYLFFIHLIVVMNNSYHFKSSSFFSFSFFSVCKFNTSKTILALLTYNTLSRWKLVEAQYVG